LITLLLHTVLVKLDDIETTTQSGIILALDEKKERKAVENGTVIQVGPTAFQDYGRDPSILKGGDRISLNRYSGKSIVDTDGVEYVIVNDVDILCKVE
jgi:co-chaperonin GroES (HSP10)